MGTDGEIFEVSFASYETQTKHMDSIEVEPVTNPCSCHVVAMPYPGRGLINPMMNLCRVLVSKRPDFLITFVLTEEWHRIISSESKPPANICFATIPNCIPSEVVRANDPLVFVEAVFTKMEAPFEQLLDELAMPFDAIIADTLLPWVPSVGNCRRVPVASLWTQSATMFSLLHHSELLRQNHILPAYLSSEQGEERVDYIPGVPSIRLADLPAAFFNSQGLQLIDRGLEAVSMVSTTQYLLLGTVYELEASGIDALKPKFPLPVYHIGPLIPHLELEEKSSSNVENCDVPYYLKWLDSQPEGSVLYVSMGSYLSVSSAQMDEIIAGLQNSEVRFLLVSRGKSNTDCGDKGVVVSWCYQLRVLCHPSVGGFWTHCGWNSTVEAVFAGVPMLTSPIAWDQFPNSKTVVEDLKIGWRVKSEAGDMNLMARKEIAEVVRSFTNEENSMVKEMRKRARELQRMCQSAIAEGGSSDTNLDCFIRKISGGDRPRARAELSTLS